MFSESQSQSQSRIPSSDASSTRFAFNNTTAPDREGHDSPPQGRRLYTPQFRPSTSSRLFGFAARPSPPQQEAPLFHHRLADSVDDDYLDDQEDDSHRDAAELYALQRSRRVAAASKLADSLESENDTSRASLGGPAHTSTHLEDSFTTSNPQSQSHSRPSQQRRQPTSTANRGKPSPYQDQSPAYWQTHQNHSSLSASSPTLTHNHLVDVGLGSTQLQRRDSNDPPPSLVGEAPPYGMDSDLRHDASQRESLDGNEEDREYPPSYQQPLRPLYHDRPTTLDSHLMADSEVEQSFLREGPHGPAADGRGGRGVSDRGGLSKESELFSHDSFFAWAYLIMLASMFSTFFLIWLHTSPPDRKNPIGDTVYTSLRGSLHMLAVDTVFAVMVALLWLAALRSFVRPLVTLIIVAVPVVLVSFFLYPFLSSFQTSTTLQDRVLRWSSVVPLVGAFVWTYCVVKGRHSIHQAIEILEFSGRILGANPALVLVGMGSLALIVTWTWIWLSMFTRIFLGGYLSKTQARWIIQASTWWLAGWFIFMYMWTISVVNEVHRATTAATVSQWYFHRNAAPAPTSREIVQAALTHATTTMFGSVCEATLLARVVRLPILLLPSRLSFLIQRILNSFILSPIVALTNPLTITYAAIHSQNLGLSARGLSQLEFIATKTPTTTLTPRVFSSSDERSSGLVPYRLAKLLLNASRWIMAIAMGFAGWVITARQLEIQLPDGTGVRGSLYAYMVGVVASFIGYSVMGAMESVLSGIVDGVVVCYGSERKMTRDGGTTYCMEAAYLFGRRRRTGDYA